MALLQGGKLAVTAAFRAHGELQSGKLVKASNTLSGVKVDGYAVAREAQELMKRVQAVEVHYRGKEEAVARKIGQLHDEEQRMRETKRSIEAELSRRKSDLQTHRSSLREAEDDLATTMRKKEKAKDNKKKMIVTSVGVGIAGLLFTAATGGAGAPIAAAAFGACAGATVSLADDQRRAEKKIRQCREVISEAERDIRRCNERISQIERETPALTRQIEELEQEAGRYHEERGEMKGLIAFVQEAQTYWEDFAAATQHGAIRAGLVENLARKAQKRRFFSFFTRRTGRREAMSFLEAWEEVQSIAKSGSEHLFQIDFECSQCERKFRHLPYAHDMQLVCSSCNALR